MTYEFKGIFTQHRCETLGLDHRSYTLRDLRPRYPFFGIRIHPRRDEAGDDTVSLEHAVLEIIDAGLTTGLALSYATFGGPLEHLAGFQIDGSMVVEASRFESQLESLDDDLLTLFISKMKAYGLPPETNGFFFPFERGFWGE